jgi:putative phosphoribosyl transferase
MMGPSTLEGCAMAHDSLRLLPFADRTEAGTALADAVLANGVDPTDAPVVAALPRGGVPVAAEVARALHAPLDVIIVRKLGVPGQPELAMGAIGEGGVRVLEPEVLAARAVSGDALEAVQTREELTLRARAERLRGSRSRIGLRGRTVVIVDDGLATGSTARAAVGVARAAAATRVIVAVPVAPPSTVQALEEVADAVVAVATPEPFAAIGQWYRDFSPTSDDEVVRILDRFSA